MMNFFNWCKEDKTQKALEPEPKQKPEPKGLEIVTITPPLKIEVKYNGDLIGIISERKGSYKFIFLRSVIIHDPTYNLYLDSDLLKGIAAKLDELNGADNDK